MGVHLHTPDHIRVRVAEHEQRGPTRSNPGAFLLDVALRGLLTGAGAGLVVFAGDRANVGSVAAVGILALGAALVSWDR